MSAEAVESHDLTADTPLVSYPLNSTSSLVLVDEREEGVASSHPDDIIAGSISIEEIIDPLPLSELASTIASTIESCNTDPDNTCIQSLTLLLQKLTAKDIASFLDDYFSRKTESEQFTQNTIAILNALSHLTSSKGSTIVSDALSKHLMSSADSDESIVVTYLMLLNRGGILAGR